MPEAEDLAQADAPAAAVVPLSIGEVLSVLSEEFPDITISKIRFLESQGLVRPERNASGYRQFGEADIERLRWILRQQRDHFLPLKVIKRALDEGEEPSGPHGEQPTLWTATAGSGEAEAQGAGGAGAGDAQAEPAGEPPGHEGAPAGEPAPSRPRHSTPADVVAALQEDPRAPAQVARRAPSGPSSRAGTGRPGTGRGDASPGSPDPGADQPAGREPGEREPGEREPGEREPGEREPGQPAPGVEESGPPGAMQLGRDELLEGAGLDGAYLDALEEYGLVTPTVVGGESTYDGTDLAVARAAARCAELGVGPRHLRIYKVAADREAGLVEQVVMPLLKQRNPAAREQAAASAAELTQLGAAVHAALLRRELGPGLTP